MSDQNAQPQQPPRPDPALKLLDRFVGTWDMKGRTLESEVDNVNGRTTFEWLPGGRMRAGKDPETWPTTSPA